MGLKQPQTELVHSFDMVVDIYPEVCVFYQSSLNTVKVGRNQGPNPKVRQREPPALKSDSKQTKLSAAAEPDDDRR